MTFKNIKTDFSFGEKMFGSSNLPPVNLASMVWTPYLNTYQPQSFLFKDTNECSQLGGFIAGMEKFFNWAERTGNMPQSLIDFGNANGYKDSNGDWAFSVRYLAIQDGTSINGNLMQSGYRIFPSIGLIPESMLDWNDAEAALYTTQAEMDAAYYSPNAITPGMKALGQQFLAFIGQFDWGWWWNNPNISCPISVLRQALLTSPVSVAVPVNDATWNQTDEVYYGGTATDHCVDVYEIDTVGNPNFPIFFTDQYQPWLKQFAANYFIPCVIGFNIVFKQTEQASVSPVIATQTSIYNGNWLSRALSWLAGVLNRPVVK